MRDSKSLFLLVFALVLITVSFVLISIWGYHFYFQNTDVKPSIEKKSLIAQKTFTRDSLQNLLDSTVQQLGVHRDTAFINGTDSLDDTLKVKLIEYNRLKEKIAEILKNKTSQKDTSVGSEKIAELQETINDLRNQNNQVAQENEKLNKMVQELLKQNKHKEKKSDYSSKVQNTQTEPTIKLPLLVSHLKFSAISISGDYVQQTNQASEAVRLDGSFKININSDKNNSPDIYIIITQPNGKVLLNSAWESGTFGSSSERKVYSVLLHFDNKDNNSRLHFSINSNRFQKGVYTMEVYHNSIMIARLTKRLS